MTLRDLSHAASLYRPSRFPEDNAGQSGSCQHITGRSADSDHTPLRIFDAMATQNSRQLQLCFAHREQPYIFTQPACHFPASKVVVFGEAGARPWPSAPLIRVYDDAHYVYHGFMEQLNPKDAASEGPMEVALKWVTGQKRIARLRQEAVFYETKLGTVQGVVVPRYYGYFTAEVEGAKVACIVLEWCDGRPTHNIYELK